MSETALKVEETDISTGKRKRRSKLALIALILGSLYLLYSAIYWGGSMSGDMTDAEFVGAGLATALVLPHIVLLLFAVVFNAIGYLTTVRGFILTAGILYAVSGIVFIIYFPFVIVQSILCFVSYARSKKKEA